MEMEMEPFSLYQLFRERKITEINLIKVKKETNIREKIRTIGNANFYKHAVRGRDLSAENAYPKKSEFDDILHNSIALS